MNHHTVQFQRIPLLPSSVDGSVPRALWLGGSELGGLPGAGGSLCSPGRR